MWFELVRRLGFSRRAPSQPRHPLFQDLDALDLRQQRELACALSMLWDEFAAGGMSSGSGAEDPGSGRDYVLSMHLAAYKVRQTAGPEKLHYALAPQLMALYAETLQKPRASPQDYEVAAAVREVAAQGSLIRRAGSGLRSRPRE